MFRENAIPLFEQRKLARNSAALSYRSFLASVGPSSKPIANLAPPRLRFIGNTSHPNPSTEVYFETYQNESKSSKTKPEVLRFRAGP